MQTPEKGVGIVTGERYDREGRLVSIIVRCGERFMLLHPDDVFQLREGPRP